ncbi:ComEA family DNA-binding protein [Nocardioides caeni]|uniref:ComEA family DNA-binding protein n=2 Tax=Nocardioides caeni TaxID=574700 RepID=A0A4S8NLY7_9ACTN|nr:ComEA family DNA-binding protein [Nocardioides caeni]
MALAVTTWWVVRDRAETSSGPAEIAAGSGEPLEPLEPLAADASMPDDAAGGGETVTVDVAGKVRRPGIVVLDEGARVTDALEAAGGARRGVDLTSVNLARILVDGEQIVVGAPAAGPGSAPAGPAGGPSGGPVGALVNLNLAGVAELEGLPEVGPVTAAAIVAWRDEHGGFTSVDELLEVDGIGAKTLETIAPHVTV